MKLPTSTLTFREKQLCFEALGYLVLTLIFLAGLYFRPSSTGLAKAFLLFSWMLPIFYTIAKGHTTDDTRTDERDAQIKAQGEHDGYLCMLAGVFLLVDFSQVSAFHIVNELFVLWMVSRTVCNGKQLRLYAGHESWMPDSFRASRRKRLDDRLSNMDPEKRGELAERYSPKGKP